MYLCWAAQSYLVLLTNDGFVSILQILYLTNRCLCICREYKEALRQQRNQDTSSIYRPKEQLTPPDGSHSNTESPTSLKSQSSTSPSPTIYSSSNQSSPMSPYPTKSNDQNGHSTEARQPDDASTTLNGNNKKPVQKVTPSRYQSPTQSPKQYNNTINGNHLSKTVEITTTVTKEYNVYVKPSSPLKTTAAGLAYNSVPVTSPSGKIGVVGTTTKVAPKQNRWGLYKRSLNACFISYVVIFRSVSWNRDIPAEKLSFTMRREFDKHKEEAELIEQMRKVIDCVFSL